MKKQIIILTLSFILFSCLEKKVALPPNDKVMILYVDGYIIDFENKRLIIDNHDPLDIYSKYPNTDTIKINLLDEEINYLNNLYIKNDIDNINGYMENELRHTSANMARVIFSRNHEIYITDNYTKNGKNKKVINYLYEVNEFLDRKMEKEDLYQKNIEKIKAIRKLF